MFPATTITAHILSVLNKNDSEVVQIASIIAETEKQELESWPGEELSFDLPIAMKCLEDAMQPTYKILTDQRVMYAQLNETTDPDLLEKLTYGFTKILSINDETQFVQELIQCGKRKSGKVDEELATDDETVFHVALSYKHSSRWDDRGTINERTAKEALQIIKSVLEGTNIYFIRVWIYHNIKRYVSDGKDWHEVGFIPYATLYVVSDLAGYCGFTIGRTRPWIWVETGLALFGRGIACLPEIVPISEIVTFYRGPPEWFVHRTGIFSAASGSLWKILSRL